jgi:F0F1-type ATP synthase membrane subunit b/b'
MIDRKRTGLVGLVMKLGTRCTVLGLVILLGAGIACLIASYAPNLQTYSLLVRVLRDTAIGFLVAAGVSGVTDVFIIRYYDEFKDNMHKFVEDDVRQSLEQIRLEIGRQTSALKEGVEESLEEMQSAVSTQMMNLKDEVSASTDYLVKSASSALETMRRTGLTKIYATREDAADDMIVSLASESVTQVRIIGISMNDFFADASKFREAMRLIDRQVGGGHERGCPLDIKILICHPDSRGAQLRAQGEASAQAVEVSRLQSDVVKTATHFLQLERIARRQQRVRFEARCYQTAPVLFLFRMDTVSYVQQYFFWKPRLEGCDIPVFRFENREGQHSKSMHEQMADHFDWLWEKASIPVRDYLLGSCIGVDKGLAQADAVNVFNDDVRSGATDQGRKRLLWHLKNTSKCLWLHGLSLHSFFTTGEFLTEIRRLVQKSDLQSIRVLLLDPDCEQARYRAYREHCLRDEKLTFQEYESRELHKESRLYRETLDSIRQIRELRRMSSDLDQKFSSRLYKTAPAFFMLRADDHILIEQYHYGKIVQQGDAVGKDMPLMEFSEQPQVTFDDGKELFQADPGRKPFGLIVNHFDFVFGRCSQPISDSARAEEDLA